MKFLHKIGYEDPMFPKRGLFLRGDLFEPGYDIQLVLGLWLKPRLEFVDFELGAAVVRSMAFVRLGYDSVGPFFKRFELKWGREIDKPSMLVPLQQITLFKS